MPRPTRRIRGQYEELSNTAIYIATDGFWGDPNAIDTWDEFELSFPTVQRERPLEAWVAIRAAFLPDWIRERPGSRPLWWWEFDAPRMPETDLEARGWLDTFFAAHLVEPRLRLGGTGVPVYEHAKGCVPVFEYGLPKYWHSIDPADPPQFESQAAYLDRHNLLTPSEKRLLTAKDFQPETVQKEKN
jgi:hypothetical protein